MATAAESKVGSVVRSSEKVTSQQGAVYPPGICAEAGAQADHPADGSASRMSCSEWDLSPFYCLKATQARINHAAMNAAPPIGVSAPSQGVPVSASA